MDKTNYATRHSPTSRVTLRYVRNYALCVQQHTVSRHVEHCIKHNNAEHVFQNNLSIEIKEICPFTHAYVQKQFLVCSGNLSTVTHIFNSSCQIFRTFTVANTNKFIPRKTCYTTSMTTMRQ